jgi:hypothetical protein
VLISRSLRRYYPNQVQGVDPNGSSQRDAPPFFLDRYTENELPQPQEPVELGLLNLKPAPWSPST